MATNGEWSVLLKSANVRHWSKGSYHIIKIKIIKSETAIILIIHRRNTKEPAPYRFLDTTVINVHIRMLRWANSS